MPRVVPSQVVATIDQLFPSTIGINHIGRGNAGALSGLVRLVEMVPDELLVMDHLAFAGLTCSVAHIKEKLLSWVNDRSSRSEMDFVVGFGSQSPITLIRAALAQCPDEYPGTTTSKLIFIPDAELRGNLRNDVAAIDVALANGEWKAATVLAGSAIEALLLWDLTNRHSKELVAAVTALVGNKTFDKKPSSSPDEWSLHHYLEVAAYLKILKGDTLKEAQLAKSFRNLIHPGKAQRLGQKCDRGTALASVAALEHVVRDLS